MTAWGTGYETAQDGDDDGADGDGAEPGELLTGLLSDRRGQRLALTVALFGLFFLVDRLTDLQASLERADLGRPVLLLGALANRWYLFLLLAAGLAAGAVLAPRRLLAGWNALDHGWALRRFTAATVVVLVWENTLYDVNYLTDQTHLVDRWLVVLLAAAALIRPVALIPFIIQVRVVGEQFLQPFGTTAGRNIDQVLLLVVLAAAAAHVRYVLTRRTDTSDAVLVTISGLAAHFFVPGWSKLQLGWIGENDLSNLPLAGYTAGWLGGSDGWWADGLHIVLERFGPALMIIVLVVELSAPLAALRPTLARFWIPLAVVFHLGVFAVLGFWFLAWLVVELGLLALLWTDGTRRWLRANDDLGRGLLGVAAATVGASLLFHPAGLVWFDAPVSYGYRFEAVGVSGERYNVPISAFAPYDDDIAFRRVQLGSVSPVSGAYGAVASADDLERFDGITDAESLAAAEARLEPPELSQESEELIRAWVAHVNDDWSDPFPLTAPGHFWSSVPDPEYRHQEPIERLEVTLLAVIHDGPDGEPVERRTTVLVVEDEPSLDSGDGGDADGGDGEDGTD